jgi:argininosuccinate lyase
VIAKTAASGGPGLLPEVLRHTSALAQDQALLKEDLVGSLAHLAMLSRQRIVPRSDAAKIREALLHLAAEATAGDLALPPEEDVHMAVEAELTRRLGEVAGRLHTARSRNDQIALDLRLHLREHTRLALLELGSMLRAMASRADEERDTILPAYTHRQRAQAISGAYLFCSYGAMFQRDVAAFRFALSQIDASPLGVGALAGTSLPVDREIVRSLLGFSRVTLNGLDTVGDRDFALDFSYAAARCHVHCSRIAQDVIDFASTEFGFLKLEGAIACGSSLMPQKRNPDLFELVRARTAAAVGNVVSLFTILRGLPSGYNRDLQEDRSSVLSAGPLLLAVLDALRLGLRHVRFDRERCLAAVTSDYMQAADVAEALVQCGIPFRTAYLAVGRLVADCQAKHLPLAQATAEMARAAHPNLSGEVLSALSPTDAVARKKSAGGTGPEMVEIQIAALHASAGEAEQMAASLPSLDALLTSMREVEL